MARKGVPVHGDLHSELKNGVKLCECVSQPRIRCIINLIMLCVCVCVRRVCRVGKW